MLDSLAIRNYRNLKALDIPSLGRVNLITGKNNTGKSAILEAVAIYATRGNIDFIFQLLNDRGENYTETVVKAIRTDVNVRSLSSLFTNRQTSYNNNDAISIGNIAKKLPDGRLSPAKSVELQFVRYNEDSHSIGGKVVSRIQEHISNKEIKDIIINTKAGFEIQNESGAFILPLDSFVPFTTLTSWTNEDNLEFVRAWNSHREINGQMFDKIALTEKEQHVINALKIIEPTTERIAFIEEVPGKRTAVLKLSGMHATFPLRSMGDGINRILTIILAMVNAEGGCLLIDEFENGLHYTVQEQLWNIIFKLAQELNVQVFATTHSEDCIAAFSRVLNTPNQTLAGKLIRLDNVNGTIKQVEYNAEELKIATDQNIETR